MITIGNFVMPFGGLRTVIGAIFILLSLAIDFSFGKSKTLICSKIIPTIQKFIAILVVEFLSEGYKIRKIFA